MPHSLKGICNCIYIVLLLHQTGKKKPHQKTKNQYILCDTDNTLYSFFFFLLLRCNTQTQVYSSPPPNFEYEVLLEYNWAHQFTAYLFIQLSVDALLPTRKLSSGRNRMAYIIENIYYLTPYRTSLLTTDLEFRLQGCLAVSVCRTYNS